MIELQKQDMIELKSQIINYLKDKGARYPLIFSIVEIFYKNTKR